MLDRFTLVRPRVDPARPLNRAGRMGELLLTNGTILNPGGQPAFLERGDIAISDGVITAVGSAAAGGPQVEVVDLEGMTVLPGLINAHTHLYSSLALGMPPPELPPANFVEIMKAVWWRLDLALDEASTRASFEAGFMASLRAGVTTVIDHHSSQNFITGSLAMQADIAGQLGINVAVAFEVTDRNGPERFAAGLAENLAALAAFEDHATVHPLVGLHASFTLSDASLGAVRDALRGVAGWGVHIHVAEDAADQRDAVERGYPSVIQRLRKFDLLNDRSLVIHGVHMLPGDVAILKSTGAALVHNPTSNANNRVGSLDGGTVAALTAGLGSDGMQASMLTEAKEGTLIRSSHLAGGAANIDYLGLLFGHNTTIATNLFGRKIGRIEPGYQADLAVFDYDPHTEIDAANMAGHILFGLAEPRDVMSRGVFRIRHREFVDFPAAETNARAREESARLWRTMAQT